MAHPLFCEIAELWHMLRRAFDPYRPEHHYMRGPGPKWQEKQLSQSVL